MEETEYKRLVESRDRLVELQPLARTTKHKQMIEQQLSEVRAKIKQAHHEQYHRK